MTGWRAGHAGWSAIYLNVTYFVLLVEVSFSLLCLLLIASQNRKLEGMRSMVAAFVLLEGSNICVLLRGHAPDFFPSVLGNVLLGGGLSLLHFSFPEVGKRLRVQRRISVVLVLVMFTACMAFTYWHDSHAWRVYFVSLCLTAQAASTALILFRFAEPEVRYPTRCTAGMFALIACIQLYRAWWIGSHGMAPDEIPGSTLRWVVLLGYAVMAASVPLLYFWTMTVRFGHRLELMAFSDPLTGLLNRRGIEQEIAAELARLARQEFAAPLSVVLLDLDHFKAVNDRFGHLGGDCVLQELAALMPPALRPFDRVGRLGGEEFLVLLPHTTYDQAVLIAERLRSRIAMSAFEFNDRLITITASLGVASTSSRNGSWIELMRDADAALYRAKAEGRNQVGAPLQIFEPAWAGD